MSQGVADGEMGDGRVRTVAARVRRPGGGDGAALAFALFAWSVLIHDKADGSMECAWNMTLLHGVRSSEVLKETGDPVRARAAGNPELSPHLECLDYAGHGYTTVRATPDQLEAEFVCIPIPMERSETDDGGPLRYRVAHRVPLWRAGQRPEMTQDIREGDPGLAI